MDSWTGWKRPWEEDDSSDLQPKRRDLSATASSARRTSPLPPQAAYNSRDNEILSQRRLPPFYTPSCGTSAECITSRSSQLASPPRDVTLLNVSGSRSQSRFNVFEHSRWQTQQQDHTGMKILSYHLYKQRVKRKQELDVLLARGILLLLRHQISPSLLPRPSIELIDFRTLSG